MFLDHCPNITWIKEMAVTDLQPASNNLADSIIGLERLDVLRRAQSI
jgi:hypothetical protein